MRDVSAIRLSKDDGFGQGAKAVIPRPEGNGGAFGGAAEVEGGGVEEVAGEEVAVG